MGAILLIVFIIIIIFLSANTNAIANFFYYASDHQEDFSKRMAERRTELGIPEPDDTVNASKLNAKNILHDKEYTSTIMSKLNPEEVLLLRQMLEDENDGVSRNIFAQKSLKNSQDSNNQSDKHNEQNNENDSINYTNFFSNNLLNEEKIELSSTIKDSISFESKEKSDKTKTKSQINSNAFTENQKYYDSENIEDNELFTAKETSTKNNDAYYASLASQMSDDEKNELRLMLKTAKQSKEQTSDDTIIENKINLENSIKEENNVDDSSETNAQDINKSAIIDSLLSLDDYLNKK